MAQHHISQTEKGKELIAELKDAATKLQDYIK